MNLSQVHALLVEEDDEGAAAVAAAIERIAELEAALVEVTEGWLTAKREGELICISLPWKSYQSAKRALMAKVAQRS